MQNGSITPLAPGNKINRLRVKHIRIIHRHTFQHESPTQCETSEMREPYLILDYQKYNKQRQKHNIVASIQQTLENNKTTNNRLINFLKGTQLSPKL